MTERLVITGMGAITPIGIGIDEYWNNLLAGHCGIEEIEGCDLEVKIAAQSKAFKATDFMPRKKASEMNTLLQMALVAATEAVDMSGIEHDSDRIGSVIGTALNGFNTITATQKKYDSSAFKRSDPRLLTKALGNIASCHISAEFGFKGPAMTVSTACASGGDAVTLAAMFIRSGMADAMVVSGAECGVDEILMQSLVMTKAISPTGSRPFDKSRDGFVIGEGAGAMVIETESHAKARGAKIIAVLAGWGNNSDGYNVVAPDPSGEGEMRCMRQALETAGIEASKVGYINAHGTSTVKGDEVELYSIGQIFDNSTMVGSTKGATGHMMGGGGITEIITCIKAVETGIIPPTTGLKDPMTDEINLVMETPVEKDIEYAMSNAFGFGCQNSSVIVGKYNE